MSKTTKIFTSYAREDKNTVREIYARLQELGYNPWMDESDIYGGEQWERKIRDTIQKSVLVLIFLSKKSVKKNSFFQQEIKLALEEYAKLSEEQIFIIPVRLDNCALPKNLNHIDHCNIFESDGFDKLIRSINFAIEQSQSKSAWHKHERWHWERINWPQSVAKIIKKRQLGVVLQCGGHGRRLGRFEPKPLVRLPDKNCQRPIEKLIKDIPPEVPIYLHGMAEEKFKYLAYLAANNNFGREVYFIPQHEHPMYSDRRCEEPLQTNDNCFIYGSSGPATFILHFVEPPTYFFVTDGSKLGIHFMDIAEALDKLNEHSNADIIVFTFRLNEQEIEREKELYKTPNQHTRFARIDVKNQKVYEYPDKKNCALVSDPDSHALAGMYIVRSNAFLQFVQLNEGLPIELESFDSLTTGFVKHLKMAMSLNGFPIDQKGKGLAFDTYELKRDIKKFTPQTKRLYIKGIKEKKDIDEYESNAIIKYLDKQRDIREKALPLTPKIGLLLNCAGRGERLSKLMPEPLVALPDEDRPVTCILKDSPPEVPVYLHLLQQYKSLFLELLNEYKYFGHDVSYIIQPGVQMYEDKEGTKILSDPHGVRVMTSSGAANFGLNIDTENVPEYLIITDGDKTGLDYHYIRNELFEKLIHETSVDIIVLVRRLNEIELEKEKVRAVKSRRRYARIQNLGSIDAKGLYWSNKKTKVFDPVILGMKENPVWEDKCAFALCGTYVIRTKEFCQQLYKVGKAPMIQCWSFNSLHSGYARRLKMSMCLQGFQGTNGFAFSAVEISNDKYIRGIKEKEDIDLYTYERGGPKYRYRVEKNARDV